MHHLVVEVQTADAHYQRRGTGRQGADDHAADEYGPEGQDEGAPRPSGGAPFGRGRVVLLLGRVHPITGGRASYFRPKTCSGA